MPIKTATIVQLCASALDAEGSDRYLFDQDYKPNINAAIKWMVSVFNAAFGAKKLTEESLKEITYTKVWQANAKSRVSFNAADVGHSLWTILAVMPEPTVTPETAPGTLADANKSVYMSALSFVESDYSCERLTIEEWSKNKKNIFESGNTILTNGLKSYAYLDFMDFSSSGYVPKEKQEITIRPDVASKFVAMSYIKIPKTIDYISQDIEFPDSLTDLIFQKTLQFMSYKQGDGTSLYSVTDRDITKLVNTII